MHDAALISVTHQKSYMTMSQQTSHHNWSLLFDRHPNFKVKTTIYCHVHMHCVAKEINTCQIICTSKLMILKPNSNNNIAKPPS
jgi:hypothetical protein